jgi:ankyrin repeat protein
MKLEHLKLSSFKSWLSLALSYSLLGTCWNVVAQRPAMTIGYMDALRSGNVERLRSALDHGSLVEARDSAGNTPLMLATAYGDVACMRLLLERGALVNSTNSAGANALMRAAGDYGKVKLLVSHGASVNMRSGLGNTALMLASRTADSHRSVELLLAHGADARATNNWGATALMASAAGGDLASVKLLLKDGADANAQPVANPAAFVFNGGRSALMWAAYLGENEIVKTLLDAGADVNGEGLLGTPLTQTAWSGQTETARLLLARGAKVEQAAHFDGYTPLHWAASSERAQTGLLNLLLEKGADPNKEGGENVDAFMDVRQTPLMLAKRRGSTPLVAALTAAGATNETPDRVREVTPPVRELPERLNRAVLNQAISLALAPLQKSSIESKRAFVEHASHQDCVSCHQQSLPLAAIGAAKKMDVAYDKVAERELVKMVGGGDTKMEEADWQALFHPEPTLSKGYLLFAYALEGLPADAFTDAWVHHLSAIQAADGRWHNNLPRPPIQTSDIAPTALAIRALQHYGLPGRKAETARQVERARKWLRTAKAETLDEQAFQLLGLAWAGEPASTLQASAQRLVAEQRANGGWAQLKTLESDAYATGQAVYALNVAAGIAASDPALDRGRRYLLTTQLEDGTWYIRRRAFPFQPTMKSGFPHGRDSWISAMGTSWAALALSLPEATQVASNQK